MDTSVLDDKHYAYRLPLVAAAGAACALLLTWFMYALIQSSHPELDESERVHLLDFVRIKKAEQSERVDRKPQRPLQAPKPPAPALRQAQSNTDTGASLTIEAPDASQLTAGLGGLAIGAGEGEYLPLIKVAPVYPPKAMAKRLQGTCAVSYTVTKNGSVRDVRVLEGECEHDVFERPSIKAAEKFKYKPRIVNGEAVEVQGVLNRFTYELMIDDESVK
ncbi:TonB family protein [Exilibacterium tricleocarpae]|uniref:TonB family protein n=1 Tax=Exilibacterium tricleocarpae TaxID=2591008 RepID=A0A545SZ19_9GAMM|nr:energy transducer TonB [Exilibacterium tricleocarpae]TQV70191.1 TonB family protein [Exilibacterium tricleocarpae]